MNASATGPTIAGPAYRVTILTSQQTEAYERVHAQLDGENGVVHVFSEDGTTHYLTIPVACALIEWRDPANLRPQPRIPPFGPDAFTRLGEQVHRMAAGLGRAFGPGAAEDSTDPGAPPRGR